MHHILHMQRTHRRCLHASALRLLSLCGTELLSAQVQHVGSILTAARAMGSAMHQFGQADNCRACNMGSSLLQSCGMSSAATHQGHRVQTVRDRILQLQSKLSESLPTQAQRSRQTDKHESWSERFPDNNHMQPAKPPPGVAVVPAHLAEQVALRHVGMVQLPQAVDRALEEAVLGAGISAKELRGMLLHLDQQMASVKAEVQRSLPAQLQAASAAQGPGVPAASVHSSSPPAAVRLRSQSGRFTKQAIHEAQFLGETVTEGSSPAGPQDSSLTSSSPVSERLAMSDEMYNAVLGLPPPLHAVSRQRTGPNSEGGQRPGPERGLLGPSLRYSEHHTRAAAATQAAPGYAAALRVLHDIKVACPDFEPARVLDYGSGLGSASWAVQEVWPDIPGSLLCMEPSPHMARLGQSCQSQLREQQQQESLSSERRVSWVQRLPELERRGERPGSSSRCDLVICSHVLGETPEAADRQLLVQGLWEMTGDMLVIIEPGTQAGSGLVQAARSQVLGLEARKAAREARRQQHQQLGQGSDQDLQPPVGAHVLAPCPHDGTCPLMGSDTPCRFGQKVRVPKLARVVVGSGGATKSGAWGREHVEHSFSYVVLRRGARPEVRQPFLDPSAEDTDGRKDTGRAGQGSGNAGGSALLYHLPEPVIRHQILLNRLKEVGKQPAEELLQMLQEHGSELLAPAEESDVAEQEDSGEATSTRHISSAQLPEQPEQIKQRRSLFAAEEEGARAGDSSSSSSSSIPNEQGADAQSSLSTPQLRLLSGDNAPQKPGHQHRTAQPQAEHFVDERSVRPISAAFEARYPGYGRGMIDRLIQAGGDPGQLAGEELQQTLPADNSGQPAEQPHHPSGLSEPQQPGSGDTAALWAVINREVTPEERARAIQDLRSQAFGLGSSSPGVTQLDLGGPDVHVDASGAPSELTGGGGADEPGAEAVLSLASRQWSRVIRPPRVRGGHVILDLCSAAAKQPRSEPDGQQQPGGQGTALPLPNPAALGADVDASRGVLARQVVSRSKASLGQLARPAYALARQLQWGDVWPLPYQGARAKVLDRN